MKSLLSENKRFLCIIQRKSKKYRCSTAGLAYCFLTTIIKQVNLELKIFINNQCNLLKYFSSHIYSRKSIDFLRASTC